MSNELFHDVHSLSEDAYLAACAAAREVSASHLGSPTREPIVGQPHKAYATSSGVQVTERFHEWADDLVAALSSGEAIPLPGEVLNFGPDEDDVAKIEVVYEEDEEDFNPFTRECEGCDEAGIEGNIVRDVELLMRDNPAPEVDIAREPTCEGCGEPTHLTADCEDIGIAALPGWVDGPYATAMRALIRAQGLEQGVYLTRSEAEAILEQELECARWH